MKNNFLRPPRIIYTIITILLFLSNGCRKSSTGINDMPQINATEIFYRNSDKLDPVLTKLVNNFKKQKGLNENLADFIQKNGAPVWEKTLYKVKSKNGIQASGQSNIKTNSISANAGNQDNANGNEKGFYLVPLTSGSSGEVQSYISVEQNNDSTYEYRLYNKDSLNAIVPRNDSTKKELLNLKAVFGVFEKEINGRNEIQVTTGKQGIIKNAHLKFKDDTEVTSAQKTNAVKTLGKCYEALYIEISYDYWEIGQDYIYYESWKIEIWLVVEFECGGGGGSDGGGSNGIDPGDPSGGTPSNGYGSIPPTGSYNYYSGDDWWKFGAGWPYNGFYDPYGTWYNGSAGGGGWSDLPYTLTPEDIAIWNEIDAEDAESDRLRGAGTDCYGTKRTGNIKWPGTLEHWIIMVDYLATNPIGGLVEYSIPQSSNGVNPNNRGYADIANIVTAELFEIKPENAQASGKIEVENYVLKANAFCSNALSWRKGTQYTERNLPWPKDASKILKASLPEAGVIIYKLVDKSSGFDPSVVTVPQPMAEQLKNLLKKLKEAPGNFEEIISGFLRQNPELKNYIKVAGITTAVAIVIGTIVEDALSGLAGVADDWASLVLAYRIVRFAIKLP